ncbi:hypothetical protein EDD18DRAFT_1216089 [Armillaria luteobubalina]|uniref:Uncharacterized protein n=1 Tax=Armillaria luteobubalina TaxID=153913 RepID=A0AA39P2B6_9AGAR|nr:hypothetical protein EDD18DRAFT_1216089 [Armillaria luteobubalina]
MSFGFTFLRMILYNIPRSVSSVVILGLVKSRWKDLHLYIMAFATIPGFVGVLGIIFIETNASTKWIKWGIYYMIAPFVLRQFLGLSFIPSNLPGRTTKRKAVVGCSVCFGLDFLVIVAWRTTLVLRNRRRDKDFLTDGLTQEEREMHGKVNGEADMTDFGNQYLSLASARPYIPSSWRGIVPLYPLRDAIDFALFISTPTRL